jgi:RHS repeat-associated protein
VPASFLAAQNPRAEAVLPFLDYSEMIEESAVDETPCAILTGKERDPESGLDYFGARYYSGPHGRFTSPDVPLIDQTPADPQSWNLYAYVRNNPLRFIDPLGRECVKLDDGNWGDDGKGCACDKVKSLPDTPTVTVTAGAPLSEEAQQVFAQVYDQSHTPVEWMGYGLGAFAGVYVGMAAPGWVAASADAIDVIQSVPDLVEGAFSILDWSGYPEGIPKPEGPVRLTSGQEYETNRSLANRENTRMHGIDPSLEGKQIHEIKPVKFGGSPIDPRNKIPVSPTKHIELNRWWSKLLKAVTR